MSLVHPDDRAATLAEIAMLSEGRTTLRFENRYRAKDGSYRLLSWTAAPEAVLSPRGRPRYHRGARCNPRA